MSFLLIVVIALVALGAVAAIFSIGGTDEPIVTKEGDCASCSSRSECKLAELKEEGRRKREEKEDGRGKKVAVRRKESNRLLHLTSYFLHQQLCC